jgi:hypothetical protein
VRACIGAKSQVPAFCCLLLLASARESRAGSGGAHRYVGMEDGGMDEGRSRFRGRSEAGRQPSKKIEVPRAKQGRRQELQEGALSPFGLRGAEPRKKDRGPRS